MDFRFFRENRIIKNASWIVGVKIIQAVLALLVTMLSARYLGPSNYGLLGYAQSVVAFVAPISVLGLSNVMVQELISAPEREGETVFTATALSLASSLICIVGVAAFSMIATPGEPDTILVCVLYSAYLVFQSLTLIQYWFQAKLLSKYSSIAAFIAYVFVSAYKIFLLATGKSVFWFALSYSLDSFLLAAILFFLYRRLGGRSFSFSFSAAKRLFSQSRYYIVANMMIAVFAQTDHIMLKLMIGDAATGYYSAALSCAGCVSFVYGAIIESSRPVIFEKKRMDQQQFEKSISSLYCIVMYMCLAQSVLMTVFAPLIVRILYGAAYMPSVPILRLVVWYTTFSEIGVIRNIWILAEKRQKWLWIINLSGALANVVMNYFLIPVWGEMGAAFASLFTQFFANVVVSFLLKPIRPNTKLMLRGWDIRLIKEMLHIGESGVKHEKNIT